MAYKVTTRRKAVKHAWAVCGRVGIAPILKNDPAVCFLRPPPPPSSPAIVMPVGAPTDVL